MLDKIGTTVVLRVPIIVHTLFLLKPNQRRNRCSESAVAVYIPIIINSAGVD
jgi:hypothetical protein